jgi:hypothetical protein
MAFRLFAERTVQFIVDDQAFNRATTTKRDFKIRLEPEQPKATRFIPRQEDLTGSIPNASETHTAIITSHKTPPTIRLKSPGRDSNPTRFPFKVRPDKTTISG